MARELNINFEPRAGLPFDQRDRLGTPRTSRPIETQLEARAAIGCKNWLLVGSERGGPRSGGMLQTLRMWRQLLRPISRKHKEVLTSQLRKLGWRKKGKSTGEALIRPKELAPGPETGVV